MESGCRLLVEELAKKTEFAHLLSPFDLEPLRARLIDSDMTRIQRGFKRFQVFGADFTETRVGWGVSSMRKQSTARTARVSDSAI
jgi:hypothetical protein